MPNNTTHILGFKDNKALREAAALWQADGFTTVQVGETARVHVEADVASDWPGKKWFVLIATKDPITAPETVPAATGDD